MQINNYRQALVLAGKPVWCQQTTERIVATIPADRHVWLNHSNCAEAQKFLGRELDAVVLDAHLGFNADAFGALAGTIRGGGVLILLTPALTIWSSQNRFLKRLIKLIQQSAAITLVEQAQAYTALPVQVMAQIPPDLNRCTPDQQQAIAAIIKVATGHRRRPLVLTADRGRGKSAAFGIAAAQLLQQGLSHIVVTGPRLTAVEAVFKHAVQQLPTADCEHKRSRINYLSNLLEFVPPDELALNPRAIDLLLVDEAAALPTPLLEKLLRQYARIAFATTVHGYEGSGRGFALRFHHVLGRQTPNWRQLILTTPIRWAADDPLEQFVFKALLLNAMPADEAAIQQANTDNCIIEHLDRDKLVQDETTLTQLFGLLVLAHYRTRPSDLQQLLDAPALSVYVMRAGNGGPVVATALIANEGDLDAALAQAIFDGKRRVSGHLIPQALAAHAGLMEAATFSFARIMRIAVHPAVQRRGLGSYLIDTIINEAGQQNYDWLGASFGATLDLLNFWARSELLPVRIGLNREASSGTHSSIVLKPLTQRAETLFTLARARFAQQLPQLLADPLRYLDPNIGAVLIRQRNPNSPQLDEPDWRVLRSFAFARHGFEDSLAPIWQLTCSALTDSCSAEQLSELQRNALIIKVLQKQSWQETAKALSVPGRAQVIELLRQAVQRLCSWYDANT